MMKYREKSDQRGTLLVEALAMLGLIAMVTPTLYKKSAERLQEIQDINIASQARTMNSVIETMMKANVTDLLESTSSAGNETIILTYDDESTRAGGECSGKNCFDKGYSAYVPFGFNVGEIKNYKMPTVYVHNDNSSLTSYIVYPKEANIGRKRAAKIASLVGANGGMVWEESTKVQGTGDAWSLDSSMINDLEMNEAELTENSLVVTSVEPVTIDSQDSEKFLYRVPPEDSNLADYYHNMMVTDLYMGGLAGDTSYADHARQFHSIYNARKLMLNTTCDRQIISGEIEGSSSSYCDPSIADLYIGRPVGNFLEEDRHSRGSGISNGAAWIYGNLSALNNRFSVSNTSYGIGTIDGQPVLARAGQDVVEFVRRSSESSEVELTVFHATNGENEGSAMVGMLDDFVLVQESSGAFEFMVGGSSVAGGGVEGGYIHAYQENGDNIIKINSRPGGSSTITYINDQGGQVYINQGGDSSIADTHINEDGGRFLVGENKGMWMEALGSSATSSSVYILKGDGLGASGGSDGRIFAVGNDDSSRAMIYANGTRTSLRDNQLSVFSNINSYENVGGFGIPEYIDAQLTNTSGAGAMFVNAKYADIVSSTFMTNNGTRQGMSSGVSGDLDYRRDEWALGIAGSAWVDDLLYANDAWFRDQGSRNLHAGFSSYTQYQQDRDTGWLNVYGGQEGGVYIRRNANAGTLEGDTSSAVFWADSSQVHYKDFYGAYGYVKDGVGVLGWEEPNSVATGAGNYFAADSSQALVSGSTLVNIKTTDETPTSSIVNVQEGALTLNKHPLLDNENLGNRIDARAGEFALWTTGQGTRGSSDSDAQLFANKEEIRTRYVNFTVEKEDSSTVFKVMPDLESVANSSDANVFVDGTVHITGNDVIHIASNAHNTAEVDSSRAMFEVDPDYIQVMGLDGSSTTGFTEDPLFRIGAKDINGDSSNVGYSGNASVYIRRGAIELEHKDVGIASGGDDADSGVGYIKADRLVSGSGIRIDGNPNNSDDNYDQYMVNPAYTSVMHDIKLTTRGGARLSDVLPDYVLKGVYNMINDQGADDDASPYIGIVPFAPCPPGYENLATVVPISFNVGQAGDIRKDSSSGKYVVNTASRQADVLNSAHNSGGLDIRHPNYEEASSIIVDGVYNTYEDDPANFVSKQTPRVEGWFLGVKPNYTNPAQTTTDTTLTWDSGHNYATLTTGSHEEVMAYPLYFQQNTWLKTSLAPEENSGWKAYMGFLYDKAQWENINNRSGDWDSAPVNSNYTTGGGNEGGGASLEGHYYWNLFPVPKNTLEGHATVYCYFNRSNFSNWTDDAGGGRYLVDQMDLLGAAKRGQDPRNQRTPDTLDDPSLKYKDPWGSSSSH